jgi:hypothetical protein
MKRGLHCPICEWTYKRRCTREKRCCVCRGELNAHGLIKERRIEEKKVKKK